MALALIFTDQESHRVFAIGVAWGLKLVLAMPKSLVSKIVSVYPEVQAVSALSEDLVNQ